MSSNCWHNKNIDPFFVGRLVLIASIMTYWELFLTTLTQNNIFCFICKTWNSYLCNVAWPRYKMSKWPYNIKLMSKEFIRDFKTVVDDGLKLQIKHLIFLFFISKWVYFLDYIFFCQSYNDTISVIRFCYAFSLDVY